MFKPAYSQGHPLESAQPLWLPFSPLHLRKTPFGPFFVELSKCREWIKRCNRTRNGRIRTALPRFLRFARGALREVHAVSMTCEVAGDLRQPRREQKQNISEISLGVEPEARRLHRLPAPKPARFFRCVPALPAGCGAALTADLSEEVFCIRNLA